MFFSPTTRSTSERSCSWCLFLPALQVNSTIIASRAVFGVVLTSDELPKYLSGTAVYSVSMSMLSLLRYLLVRLFRRSTDHEHDTSVTRTLLANDTAVRLRTCSLHGEVKPSLRKRLVFVSRLSQPACCCNSNSINSIDLDFLDSQHLDESYFPSSSVLHLGDSFTVVPAPRRSARMCMVGSPRFKWSIAPQHNRVGLTVDLSCKTTSSVLIMVRSTLCSASIAAKVTTIRYGSFITFSENTTPGADGKARVGETILLMHRPLSFRNHNVSINPGDFHADPELQDSCTTW